MLAMLAFYAVALFVLPLLFACALSYAATAHSSTISVADAPEIAPVDALELECISCSSRSLVAGFRSDSVVRAKTVCSDCRPRR